MLTASQTAQNVWQRARSTVAGVALTALAAHMVTAPLAHAEGAAPVPAPAQEPIPQKTCWQLLAGTSFVVSAFKDLDARFTTGLARLIAPTDTAPFYVESIHKAIVSGSVNETIASKSPEAMQWKREHIPLVTCKGERKIVTPDGEPSAASLGLRMYLTSGEKPLHIEKFGIEFIAPPPKRPPDVIGGLPPTPATLGPRSDLRLQAQ